MMDSAASHVFHDVTVGDLDQIRRYVRETAVAHGADKAALDELIVAVNEAVINIVRHGYQNVPGEIEVTVVCSRGAVEVILLDHAPEFDPTTVPSPDTSLPLVERPRGGMGVHMMRTFCDGLSYRNNPAGTNELTMLKRFEPQ